MRVVLSVVLSAIVFIHRTDHGSTVLIQFCWEFLTFFLGDAALGDAPFPEVCILSRPAALMGAFFNNVSPRLRILIELMDFEVISTSFLSLLSSMSSVSSMYKIEYVLCNDLCIGTGEVVDHVSTLLWKNPVQPL